MESQTRPASSSPSVWLVTPPVRYGLWLCHYGSTALFLASGTVVCLIGTEPRFGEAKGGAATAPRSAADAVTCAATERHAHAYHLQLLQTGSPPGALARRVDRFANCRVELTMTSTLSTAIDDLDRTLQETYRCLRETRARDRVEDRTHVLVISDDLTLDPLSRIELTVNADAESDRLAAHSSPASPYGQVRGCGLLEEPQGVLQYPWSVWSPPPTLSAPRTSDSATSASAGAEGAVLTTSGIAA